MDEELINTREEVTKEIYKKVFEKIEYLTESIKSSEDWKSELNLLLNLSEEYTQLYYAYRDFPDLSKDYPLKYEFYIQLIKDYMWKSIYYREKALNIIKEHRLIEVNSYIFMDVYLKYKFFIEYGFKFRYDENEKDFHLEIHGEAFKDNINIVINDLKYANSGIYYSIKYFEKEKNHEELFIWYEIRSDIYLIIQLLLMMTGKGLLDNAKLSLNCYKKSRENLQMISEPTTSYDGIYGYPYQVNFFDEILKSNGFRGYSRSGVEKMKFIEKNILMKDSKDYFEYKNYSKRDFLPSKERLDKKIQEQLEEYPYIHLNRNFNDWWVAIQYFHDLLLNNYDQRYLNTYVDKWKYEGDMQKFLQVGINYHLRKQNEQPCNSGREVKKGGGNSDHYYKNIPICDKWIRDYGKRSYSTKVFEFIDQVYEEYKGQFLSYIQNVKLGIIVIVDSRTETRENKSPEIVDNCYKFKVIKVNKEIAMIFGIFVLQILDISPSKRK